MPDVDRYSFHYLVYLLCLPALQTIKASVASVGAEPHPLPPAWSVHVKSMEAECSGTLPSIGDPLSMDTWVSQCTQLMEGLTGTQSGSISPEFVASVSSSLVPLQLQPTMTSAYIFCMSEAAKKILGNSLAAVAFDKALGHLSDIPLASGAPADLNSGLRQDLFMALEAVWKSDASKVPSESQDNSTPSKKRSRTHESIKALWADKTGQIRMALKNQVALNRLPDTILDANKLLADLQGRSSPSSEDPDDLLLGNLVSRSTLSRHLLVLDSALERLTASEIHGHRLAGSFVGACISTDESPPSQPRFSGLRFQVTFLYLGFLEPIQDWEQSATPPISSRKVLCDICHAPGKKGEDLLHVLDKQLRKFGISRADLVSGTGDGGGENEGRSGLHAALESANPLYVRRRCIPHLSWRTSDAAILASKTSTGDYQGLAAYLCDGVTWRRLRTLATSSKASGGLDLFRDGSPECFRVFHKAPSTIIDTRPQSDMNFLQFLRGKENDLWQLCELDLRQRKLSGKTQKAVQEMRDSRIMMCRGILAEVLHRCLFLMRWNSRCSTIASRISWEDLMTQAVREIRDLGVDDEVQKRLGASEDIVKEQGWTPRTWVELLLLQLFGDPNVVQDLLPEALKFHTLITDKAGSHLELTAGNIMGSHWTAAAMLSTDPSRAQAAATTLVKHIVSMSPNKRSPFEQALFENSELWNSMVDFSRASPPVLLWKGRGHFSDLFRLLATQFLVSPDNVLDCERQHARWQWLCAKKRSLKLPALNAFLRCTSYLEGNNMEFPPDPALEEYLDAAIRQFRFDMQHIDSDTAKGWRMDMMWADRFNLRPADHSLIMEDPASHIAEPSGASGAYSLAWRNYLRHVLQRGFFFQFSLFPSVFFYISENKIVAGRSGRGEGEAVGRSVVVTFFEPVPGTSSLTVRRVDRSSDALATKLLTIAEIMITIGFASGTPGGQTSAEQERTLEEAFAEQDLQCFRGILETSAEDIHVYTLVEGSSAEEVFLHSHPRDTLSKMALARFLERSLRHSRRTSWSLPLEQLRALAYPALPDPAGSVLSAEAGKGKGQGRAAKRKGR